MMKSFLIMARVGALLALTLVAQSSFGAADHVGGDAASLERYKQKFPEFDTVIKAFTKWSGQDNDGDIAKLEKDEHKKQADWQGNALWLRGKIDASCKEGSDPASKEMAWMLDYCFGWLKSSGVNQAATYRLVQALKDKDESEIGLAMQEVKACRAAFADMFKWKAKKVDAKSSEFKSELDIAPKIDNFFAKLEDTFEASDLKVKDGSLSKIGKHLKDYQSALKETEVTNLCRFKSDTGTADAHPTASPSPSPTPAASTSSDAQSNWVWKDKNGNPCKAGTPGCDKYPSATSNAKPVAAQALPPGTPYGAVQPGYSSPVIPNYGSQAYDPCGYSGCGGYGGGGYGGGYVPGAAAANPGVLPPPPPFVGGGGFSFGYSQGPKYPPPPPLAPPPAVAMPYGPPPMPLQFGPSGPTGGGDTPTVTKVETIVATTKPLQTSSPTPMPMPMQMGFVNRCNKPVCSPMFGMTAMMQRFPMGIQPINGFINPNIPPSVTPYYPGTTPGTNYGPITTNTGIVTTTPTSPYVNPTFYGTPNTQYQPIPSTRDRIGRV